MLLDILKTFPNHPLTFSIDDKMGVEISSDYGKYKLSGYSGMEFPKSPVIEAPSTVTISSHIFQRAIEKTIFASGNDDLRPVMSGVFFQFSNQNLTFVATDAHKLVRYVRTEYKTENLVEFIMPKKPLNVLKGILASKFTEDHLELNGGEFIIQSFGTGKYGRVLAEIFVKLNGEEKSLNQLLIENGHAYIYEGGKKQLFKG